MALFFNKSLNIRIHCLSFVLNSGRMDVLGKFNNSLLFTVTGELYFDPQLYYLHTVKPVSNGHPKIYKTKVLKTNGSLMKVKSIAECSLGAFCNTFDLH